MVKSTGLEMAFHITTSTIPSTIRKALNRMPNFSNEYGMVRNEYKGVFRGLRLR